MNKSDLTIRGSRGLSPGNYANIIGLAPVKLTSKHLVLIDEGDDQYKYIPLTEKWLRGFGFEKGDNKIKQNGSYVVNDSFFWIKLSASLLTINPTNGVVWIYSPVGQPFNNPQLIDSVHQLQNLYFALTGEELTLK